jgi:3-hydroxyacyl-CoA dehydrogenase / enoyl-CoA hydratase / 3-hydroxybutyryl-CoA epimerase
MSGPRLLSTERGPGDVIFVYFDQEGESVNTLRSHSAGELERIFDHIDRDPSVVAVVLSSKKADHFIAGADITMLDGVADAAAATQMSRLGQAATERIARCKVPVVAAIHGACLGGGLEIALACHGRVGSNSEKTKLGLPEVQLGILPGMGGTQRLPQIIGVSSALDLLLSGRQVSAKSALSLGLLDEVVESNSLSAAALALVHRLVDARHDGAKPWQSLVGALSPEAVKEAALADNPLGRKLVFDQAEQKVMAKTRGNYPAPLRILQVVRSGLEHGLEQGLAHEAEAFGQLVVTPEARALRHVYFAQQATKRFEGPASEEPAPSLTRVAVVGAGFMGQGITKVSLHQAATKVRLRDKDREQLGQALRSVDQYLLDLTKRGRLTPWQRQEHLNRLTTTTDHRGISESDVVIEAVFEDLDLKRRVLAEVEQHSQHPVIFATNTSALRIEDIGQGCQHPERVIGLHYFSPVDKMPLLEIVTTDKTAAWVVRAAIALGKRQGKTVIVVSDGPGFYTTRILGPYLNEAAHALLEGVAIEEVDRQLMDAGFPVGPFTLLDEIGIDVGYKVGQTLFAALGPRMTPPAQLGELIKLGRLGRKSGRGFYSYADSHKGKRPVDKTVYQDLKLNLPPSSHDSRSAGAALGNVAERCLLMMVNEAARCLGEGILRSADDGDVGAIFGLGFPAHLGGPFHLIQARGARTLVGQLEDLARSHGPRFEPAPYLRSLS